MLTGHEIIKQVNAGRIVCDPFNTDLVNPNSINVTLSPKLRRYEMSPIDGLARQVRIPGADGTPQLIALPNALSVDAPHPMMLDVTIPDTGMILYPGVLYLGSTNEVIGSQHYIPVLEGRSSLARLGVFIHTSAGFGDLGFIGTWTLEITVIHPVAIRPNIPIGQVAFQTPEGSIDKLYAGKYADQRGPVESRMYLDNGGTNE